MTAYLDASALVKRYIVERGSRDTIALTADSDMTATSHGTPNTDSPEIGQTSHACPLQKHS
jgi:hypothetical protein